MEGVAYSLRHLMEISRELGAPVQEIALSGGAANSAFWAQLIADVCRRPLLIFGGQESVTRPLYAYCAAALNADDSFDAALRRAFEPPRRLEPCAQPAKVYAAGYRRYRLLADFAAEKLSKEH
jgi:xylulokinase